MDDLGNFEIEILEDHAVFRPTGQVSVERAVELIVIAIAIAQARGIRNLMADVSNLTGFEPPSMLKRYFFAHDLARAAKGVVRVAFVTKPEMIDPQKFGSTVAANIGFIDNSFTTEDEALVWLRGLN